jgi:coproporphyrinogen III oxidase
MVTKEQISERFMELQDSICSALEKLDGFGYFHQDLWDRKEGGGGRSRIMEGGKVIEKGGVNFSKVFGEMPDFLKSSDQLQDHSKSFFATGVSIVIHPLNPWVPIIHMNVRYFEKDNGESWFGGGIDLTPHYVDPVDAQYFHNTLKQVCDKYTCADYVKYKKEADDYFFIPHRNETRGIGGIFFDHLTPKNDQEKSELFSFVLELGNLFAPIYSELVRRKMKLDFGTKEKKWQKIRRGRYVEFNLIYDRGTKFGLETNGRAESILMSLPPEADWNYNYITEEGTKEAETMSFLKKNISW